ncbi:hypothetical protein [Labrenzia sp. VG12]|uniref:hypothetical protein n=1 Tax=Labrenzia sp. VG12 TaxID=2021862 RepID=UPI0012FE5721|nr:hypothetical protein [Labrenzia sp. VG12]
MLLVIAEWLAALGQPIFEHARSLCMLTTHVLNQTHLKLSCLRKKASRKRGYEGFQSRNDNIQEEKEAA